jgi:tRNA threonylcarbamoyladenosine modification (KEOPS) complex  Pcc1 subunit
MTLANKLSNSSTKRKIRRRQVNQYSIELERNNKKLTLAVQSNDTAHVQAQAVDICRAVDATQYSISYEHIDESPLAKLFRDLAFNNFEVHRVL